MEKDIQDRFEKLMRSAEVQERLEQITPVAEYSIDDVQMGQAMVGGFIAVLASEMVDSIITPYYRKWWFRLLLRIIGLLPTEFSGQLIRRLSKSKQRALLKLVLAANIREFPGLPGYEATSLLLAFEGMKEMGPL